MTLLSLVMIDIDLFPFYSAIRKVFYYSDNVADYFFPQRQICGHFDITKH